jgi:hypothetical protein
MSGPTSGQPVIGGLAEQSEYFRMTMLPVSSTSAVPVNQRNWRLVMRARYQQIL